MLPQINGSRDTIKTLKNKNNTGSMCYVARALGMPNCFYLQLGMLVLFADPLCGVWCGMAGERHWGLSLQMKKRRNCRAGGKKGLLFGRK